MVPRPIESPTPAVVRAYVTRYDQEYGAVDQALSRLFNWVPQNDDFSSVLLKAAAVDRLYSTQLYAVRAMAEHIVRKGIDESLVSRDLTLVAEIARLEVGTGVRVNLSFASKYCSWHQPERYPIYDGLVDQALWDLKKTTGFSDFKRIELKDYERFVRAVDEFRTHFRLGEFDVRSIDKYLWLLGRDRR